MRRTYLSLVIVTFWTIASSAQTYMRVHHKGGWHSDIPIERIDSITFVDGTDSVEDGAKLPGSWLWASAEKGYYELLTLNDDKTYTSYDNFFMYGFDSMTYGWYNQHGAMLSLFSNGIGYNRHNDWFLMELTDNAMDVMTRYGQFVYYKLQSETIHLEVNGEPQQCESGDYFVFADGILASIIDGKLHGLTKGTTYIQKYIASIKSIISYKVIVE